MAGSSPSMTGAAVPRTGAGVLPIHVESQPPSPSTSSPKVPLLRPRAPRCAAMLRDAHAFRHILQPVAHNAVALTARRLPNQPDLVLLVRHQPPDLLRRLVALR